MKAPSLCFLSFSLLFLYSTLSSSATTELCHPQDKTALLQVKLELGNPRILRTWTPDTDCCTSWFLVSCNQTNNRVYFVKILYSHLVTGQISPAIGDLPYLQILSFSKLPNVTGTVPQTITKLTNLYYLEISYTGIGGPFPDFLSQLTSLTDLILSGNKFTGPVPTSPLRLHNLENLSLDKNRFTGTIPEAYGLYPNPIIYITLAGNQLTGTIPKLFRYGNFSTLDVSKNKLTGDPSFLFANPNLFGIQLAQNEFSFDFSKVKVFSFVQDLDISQNKIYGMLPKSLTKVSYLRVFNVSYNQLCGQIPVGGSLQSFNTSVYSHNKCLCGAPLPSCS